MGGSGGGSPDYLYVVVPLVILAGCVYLRPCLTGRHNRGEDAYTALLSPSVRTARNAFDRRVAIAVREAKLGFYVCVGCGFTNAQRVKSCALCGAVAKTKKKSVKAFFSEVELGARSASETAPAPTPALLPWAALTNRQRRVRRRKEWTRRLLPDRSVVWNRDDQFCDEALRAFPSYVLTTIRRGQDEERPESNVKLSGTHHVQIDIELPEHEMEPQDAEILSIQQVTTMLHEEFRTTTVSAVPVEPGGSASVGTEAIFSDTTGSHSVTHAELDFPTKLSHFITAVADLFNDAADLDDDGEDSRNKSRFFIDRDNLLSDSITAIATMTPRQARGAIRVEFTSEQGIDAGGVYREWFLLLNQKIVAPEAGLFVCVDESEQVFYLNPYSEQVLGENHLAHFLAAGRLLGRALLEGNVTGFHLALPLLKIILGLPVSISDLAYFDQEAFKHTMWLLQHDGVDALGLDFTVTEKLPDGTTREVELVPGGSAVDVTDANKRDYVDRKLRYVLFDSVAQQLLALLRGVYEVVPVELFLLFDAEELDFMLSGSDEIDVDNWQAHSVTTTELVFHPAYELFWKIVRELDHNELQRLLQFATGSTRVPPGGFGALTSQDGRLSLFTLKGVPPESTYGYLYSHACFNTLDVPLHGFEGNMRTAVRAAIYGQQIGFTTA